MKDRNPDKPLIEAKNIKDIQDLKLACMERVFLLQDLIGDLYDEVIEFREVLFNLEYNHSSKNVSDVQIPVCNEKREKATKEKEASMLEMQTMFIPVYNFKQVADKKKPTSEI